MIWAKSDKLTLAGEEEGRIPLKDWLVTDNGYGFSIQKLQDLKRRIADHNPEGWPRNSRPHGFFCGPVRGFQAGFDWFQLDHYEWRGGERVETRPQVFAEDHPRGGPYIAIVSYGLADRAAERALGLRCHMQPCYSATNWLPVDSNLERETVEALIQWRRGLPPGMRVDIHKPLFDVVVTGAEDRCRPDFVLEVQYPGGPSRTVAVETMGLLREGYEEAKSRTHPLMYQHYGLLVLDERRERDPFRREQNEAVFKEHLNNAVLKGEQFRYPSLQGFLP